jgi:hypothetical protein
MVICVSFVWILNLKDSSILRQIICYIFIFLQRLTFQLNCSFSCTIHFYFNISKELFLDSPNSASHYTQRLFHFKQSFLKISNYPDFKQILLSIHILLWIWTLCILFLTLIMELGDIISIQSILIILFRCKTILTCVYKH